MENEVVMRFEGLDSPGAREKVLSRVESVLPGAELITLDCQSGTLTVIGGDIDIHMIEDELEGLGYPRIS